MDILSEIKRMKNMMLLKENDISQIDPRSNYIFGSQEPTWGGGPNSHQSRHPDLQKNDWESSNAYDIMAPDGTPVYSITNGVVVHVKRKLPGLTAIGGKRVYGDSVTIRGVNGDPQIFYTHLENIVVEKNQDVKKGDLIGFVMKGVQGIPSHTHIGVEYGFDVKRYVDLDGKIKDLPDVLVKPKEEDKKIEGDLADNLGVAAISTATVASIGLQGSETNIKGLASRLGLVDADVNMDSVSGVLNKDMGFAKNESFLKIVSDGLFAEPPNAPPICPPIKSAKAFGDDASNAAPLGGFIKPLLSIRMLFDFPYISFFCDLNKSKIVAI